MYQYWRLIGKCTLKKHYAALLRPVTVNYMILVTTLSHYELDGNAGKWFDLFLTNSRQEAGTEISHTSKW